MATLKQLETALINADAAGDEAAARTLAAEIKRVRARQAEAKKPKPVSRTEAVVSGFERGLRPVGDIMRRIDPVSNIVNYFFPSVEEKRKQSTARAAQFAQRAEADRPGYFLGGKIAGEVAGTAPLVATGGAGIAATGGRLARAGGQMVAAGTKGGRAVQRAGRATQAAGRAVQTGGVGVRAPSPAAVAAGRPTAATRTGRMALRIGGGTAAGVGGAVLNDQEIADAAMAGAALPLVGTISRRGLGFVYDVVRQRVGEVRAAEMMRNLIASNSEAIQDALRNAPENARANTAQFLASQGLLTREMAAATNIAAASGKNAPLLAVEEARGLGQKEMLQELSGGRDVAEAMENINAMIQGVRQTSEPYRREAMSAADIGRTVVLPLERQARAFDLGAADINQSGVVRGMRGLEGRSREQLDAVFQNSQLFTPGRVVERIGEIAEQAGRRADEGIDTQLFMRDQAAIARAIADDLRAQGFKPIDISPVVGNLRSLAREALPDSDRRKLFSGFADMLEARAAEMGGVMDAEGLHFAKRDMGDFVAGVLGQRDPSAIKRGTSMMLGQTQKLIDDAMDEAAGPGTPFATFNRIHSGGMKRVEQQQLALTLAQLPPKRFEKVMANQDKGFIDLIREVFPDKLRIEDALTPQQIATARRLNSEIGQDLDIAATDLRNLPTASRAKYGAGVGESVREAMMPGMKNAFARVLIRGRQVPNTSLGISSDQIAGNIAQELQERALGHLVPALASPQAASRLLSQRSTANTLANMVNRVGPLDTLAATQAAQSFRAAPPVVEVDLPGGDMPFGNINYDEFGNYIGPRR